VRRGVRENGGTDGALTRDDALNYSLGQMDAATNSRLPGVSTPRMSPWSRLVALVTVTVVVAVVAVVVGFAVGGPTTTPRASTSTTPLPTLTYPFGVLDLSEPSGLAPPGPHAFKGYVETYVTDFTGNQLPAGWESFSGIPGGDPGGQFGTAHVVVRNGMLELNTWRDPAYHNKWVTGGLSQAGVSRTYGAYFVRTRVTGLGPNEVQLLWPADNSWPPEIDYYESGRGINGTTATVHWSSLNHIEQHSVTEPLVDWHTWGVVWSPKSILFTLDGHVWAQVSSAASVPHIPMNLDFEQRAMCSLGFDCPTKPVSMYVDWVAEYARS
jgi:hypothetical protein